MKRIKLNEMFDLPKDAFEPTPSFLLIGQRECIIDGRCELISYSDREIIFDIFYKGKCIYIKGEDLNLSCLSSGKCSVVGNICSVEFERAR